MFKATEIVAAAAANAEAECIEQLKKTDAIPLLMNFLLNQENVLCRDPTTVAAKLRKMVIGGAGKTVVISDFDYTLSRFENEQGERLSTTHGVFDDNVMRLKPELGQKFIDLKAKYYPIEFSPKLTMEEKIPHMETWWGTSHGLIINEKFSKSTIEEFVRQSRIVFRDGAEDFIQSLDAHNIPLVIFSAGIGNIIEYFLQQKLGAIPRNTHFISNMILFDEEDKACAFSEPLIHTFCKNSSVIQKETSFFHEIAGRVNVILLGDSMGDIHMDVGVERDGPTLKVGYYNGSLEDTEAMEHYEQVYDIVLVRDPTFTVAQKIVDVINSTH
uniref:5'-nucleotidase n=1 Tax=Caenorhabditis japonica TaxID=281687 RepID=A0A8R1I4E4_CAEJA